MFDTMRGLITGGADARLHPNLSAFEESDGTSKIEVTATGFSLKINSSFVNTNGNTYIYIAIRRGPMKTPESGTEVFAVNNGDGSTEPSFISNFPVDMGFYTNVNSGGNRELSSRLTQGTGIYTNTSAAEFTRTATQYDYMNGFRDGAISPAYYAWMFRRAPGFFDVMAYTGDSTNGRAIQHSLGVKPELIIVKCRNAGQDWAVQAGPLGAGYRMFLNLSTAASSTTQWGNSTEPTDTYFYVGATNQLGEVNYINYTYVAYLFASVPGVSKVGSYTGTGNALEVDCGFSTGARFVLIKKSNGSGSWYLWDSVRGIIGPAEPYLLINGTGSQVTTNDYIDALSSGFKITASAPSALNASGGEYIFLAIA